MIVSGIATATVAYRTSCGKVVMSVDEKFFESKAEYKAFLYDLNEVHCGTHELPKLIMVNKGSESDNESGSDEIGGVTEPGGTDQR